MEIDAKYAWHTCLTRWAPFMDPWTLAYLAGHRDMSITKRYVHAQEYSARAAIGWAQFWVQSDSEPNKPNRRLRRK